MTKPLDQRRILLVDDDMTVGFLVTQAIKKIGATLCVCEDSRCAIDKLKNEQFDLILLDHNLEIVGKKQRIGFDVLDESRTRVPFIMITSVTSPKLVEQANARQTLGFIVKPIISQLEPQITLALHHARARQNINEAFECNRKIDIYIGMLMQKHGVNEQDARRQLRQYCRSHQLKMIDFAGEALRGFNTQPEIYDIF